MANQTAKKSNDDKQTTTQQETTQKEIKKVVVPTYTVEEFAKAPNELGNYNADIVRAALKIDGKESYTIDEAKSIVKKFAEKEVK